MDFNFLISALCFAISLCISGSRPFTVISYNARTCSWLYVAKRVGIILYSITSWDFCEMYNINHQLMCSTFIYVPITFCITLIFFVFSSIHFSRRSFSAAAWISFTLRNSWSCLKKQQHLNWLSTLHVREIQHPYLDGCSITFFYVNINVRTYVSVVALSLSEYFLSIVFSSLTRFSHFSLKVFLSSISWTSNSDSES